MRRVELKQSYDIAIAGSGFAGSLMAMIALRLGYSVVLLEQGQHPRVVIGESSTPLANLLLEQLCHRYDLPAVSPLAKWGTWQQTYPEIACGLKRGFTFYHHAAAEETDPSTSFNRQLLVAASPHNDISDTHWYRADFDMFLVDQARAIGVDYCDNTHVERVECKNAGVRMTGTRHGDNFSLHAQFLMDATGPRGLLHRALQLKNVPLPGYPETQALWSHFEGVSRPPETSLGQPPYPPEDAAVHHLFEGGWIWVLRFNNGITSAGIAATDAAAEKFGFAEGAAAWTRLLASMPSLQAQFATARPTRPFRHIPRLSFLSEAVVGQRWALLPSAAGFVDPLLSTGFPLTLLGVERMARILESGLASPTLAAELEKYEKQTKDELLAAARLISALYANIGNFPVFRALCLLYFAAASYAETARRLNKPELAQAFLLHQHATFGPEMRGILDRATRVPQASDAARLIEDIHRCIEPIDVAGLGRPNPSHWYPVDANDLLDSCGKVGAIRQEIEDLLQRCGFFETQKAR
jgi:FADH2 O2-dependent halogenase